MLRKICVSIQFDIRCLTHVKRGCDSDTVCYSVLLYVTVCYTESQYFFSLHAPNSINQSSPTILLSFRYVNHGTEGIPSFLKINEQPQGTEELTLKMMKNRLFNSFDKRKQLGILLHCKWSKILWIYEKTLKKKTTRVLSIDSSFKITTINQQRKTDWQKHPTRSDQKNHLKPNPVTNRRQQRCHIEIRTNANKRVERLRGTDARGKRKYSQICIRWRVVCVHEECL